jgi:hypothetical protein
MGTIHLTPEQILALSALAGGIIPADEQDAGVSAFNPGRHLAEKIERDYNAPAHLKGLQFAERTAEADFGGPVADLDPVSIERLLGKLREHYPGFFKFLRAETCAVYLSEPAVWKRIGFPGPSIEKGGYPDFDQPQ